MHSTFARTHLLLIYKQNVTFDSLLNMSFLRTRSRSLCESGYISMCTYMRKKRIAMKIPRDQHSQCCMYTDAAEKKDDYIKQPLETDDDAAAVAVMLTSYHTTATTTNVNIFISTTSKSECKRQIIFF